MGRLRCLACGDALLVRKPDRGRCRNNTCHFYEVDRPLSEFGVVYHQPVRKLAGVGQKSLSIAELNRAIDSKIIPLVRQSEYAVSHVSKLYASASSIAMDRSPLAWKGLTTVVALLFATCVFLVVYDIAEALTWHLEARLSKR